MPARGSIVISDGEAIPVTHTFLPDGDVTQGHARYINRNASAPAASEFLFIRVAKGNSKLAVIQQPGAPAAPDVVELKLKYPATYVDAVSGLTLVDFIDECTVKRMTHPRSTVQRRTNLRTLIRGALAASQVVSAWDNTETIWG